mmetsp:Transcript_42634/g.92909  ORF Transcript_42634/g.92909 Transcript_42634/m.92909 type:complete len:624 (+) Transcript_42634:53-1924(+)
MGSAEDRCLEFLKRLVRRGTSGMPPHRAATAASAAGSGAPLPAHSDSTLEVRGHRLADFSDEIQGAILSFLSGWDAARAEAALSAWGRILVESSWWQRQCNAEFCSQGQILRSHDWCTSWRTKYRQLRGAHLSHVSSWSYYSRQHGLGERVAQPQIFVGPTGHRLFSYGGWAERGPVTDLHWAPLMDLGAAALERNSQSQASSGGSWHFRRATEGGQPAYRGGVQTCTPLWFGVDRPSVDHVTSTRGTPAAGANENDVLILAFGGAQGSYRNEHNDWAVGVLTEGRDDTPAHVQWVRPRPRGDAKSREPVRRGAHTATFVPARLCNGDEFPEGCVIIFGGHTNHCSESLSSMDVLALHDWSWRGDLCNNEAPMPPRHGHTTSLVEVNGRGFLVIVGGGQGNILSSSYYGGQDLCDAAVFDTRSMTWVGSLTLTRGPGVPVPGRHHSASLGLNGVIYIFGGGLRPCDKICRLDGREVIRRAQAGETHAALADVPTLPPESPSGGNGTPERAPAPTGRKMHGAACLLPWCPLLLIYGGWEIGPHFDDLWVGALGSCYEDLDEFAKVSPNAGSYSDLERDFDEDSDDPEGVPVAVRLMGGEVRIMRLPPGVLAQLVGAQAAQADEE